MLSWALRFLMAAALAAFVASSQVAPGAVLIAKIAVAVLLALCTVSLVAALRRGRAK
ncbi:MAG TPA: hypothetical protein VGJ74_14315 [Burkholderiales bacterium]|jgi:uncharacterized membrane protein YtjA (UPF0391 family)